MEIVFLLCIELVLITLTGVACYAGHRHGFYILLLSAVALGLKLFRQYMTRATYRGHEKISGKTVVITGANVGIGKETARDLARREGRIILACRDVSKGETAAKEIVQDTGNNNVFCWKLDLSSFASIRAFAQRFNQNEDRLDILINNAGVYYCPKQKTEDGLELQMGTNHFGHFLLTYLILDKLKTSAPSRIINVSSIAHALGKINFDDINSEQTYSPQQAYCDSKLANILHAVELTKRLKGTGVTANSLHPGVVATDVFRHFKQSKRLEIILNLVLSIIGKSAIQGAQTTIRLAVDPSLETVSGRYFSDCAEKKTLSSRARDEDVAKRLWELSVETTKAEASMLSS